jgi:DNA-binding transcriptional LysR family regulator
MSRALSRLRDRYPELDIQLIATTDETAVEDVRRERLDMAILWRFGPRRADSVLGLQEWLLGNYPLRVYLPSDHRQAHRPLLALSELDDEAWILTRPERGDIWRMTRRRLRRGHVAGEGDPDQ